MSSAELPPSTVTVRIRTMADDLAAAAAGAAPGEDGSTVLDTAVPIAALGKHTGATKVARHGLPIGLPVNMSADRGSRRTKRLLVVAGGVAVAAIGVWLVLKMDPRSTGTVADVLPKETLAFVSVQGTGETATLNAGGETFVKTVRAQLVRSVGGLAADRVRDAADVTYLLLPGSSPADPIPALLVRGMETIDLTQTPSIGVKKIRGGLLIAESAVLGRLAGLEGTAWSGDQELRPLFRGLPQHPSLLLGFRSSALLSVTKPFTGASPLAQSGVLAAAQGARGEDAFVVRGRFSGMWGPLETKTAVTRQLAERLPASTIFAFQTDGPALASAFLRGGGLQATTPAVSGLEALRLALAPQQDVVDKLLGLLAAGPGVVGVLPTSAPAVRDVVAVLPLRAGEDPKPLLRQLEPAFREVGLLLAGGTFQDAVFEEGEYSGLPIRYMNFGSSGRAVDYAVTDDLLLVATSRESMFALVDTARGARPSLAASPQFRPVQEAATGARWLFFQDDQSLRLEFSPAYQVYPLLFRALAMRPGAAGMVEGRLLLAPAASSVPEPVETPPQLPGSDVAPTPLPSAVLVP